MPSSLKSICTVRVMLSAAGTSAATVKMVTTDWGVSGPPCSMMMAAIMAKKSENCVTQTIRLSVLLPNGCRLHSVRPNARDLSDLYDSVLLYDSKGMVGTAGVRGRGHVIAGRAASPAGQLRGSIAGCLLAAEAKVEEAHNEPKRELLERARLEED